MKWVNEHKRYLRITFSIFLAIAISGPWFFDTIHVPAQYTCSAPNVRLDGDFCGLPLSITWFFSEILREPLYLLKGQVNGTFSFGDAFRQLVFFLVLFLLLLPVLSSVILILRGERRRWQVLHTVGLGLAAGIVGWIAWLGYSQASWMLWGLWLYVGLTVSMCILEVLIGRITSNAVQG